MGRKIHHLNLATARPGRGSAAKRSSEGRHIHEHVSIRSRQPLDQIDHVGTVAREVIDRFDHPGRFGSEDQAMWHSERDGSARSAWADLDLLESLDRGSDR
ncbi:hypothetical protein GCM10009733_071480 [Nonomuraea maheshkhaliensis]|uniref:Uncharacterized protein n=1 Tax=Nonomuraea maheshkhaliensis TaxID=419590 RepID=A0ABN2G173_9ACTN